MSFLLANPVFLFALPALAAPILIHLLSRRSHDVVDWGAMQFLEISEETQRRQRLDQWLLLLLRMLLLAGIILALAGPKLRAAWLARFQTSAVADRVFVIDASESMARRAEGRSLYEKAVKEAAHRAEGSGRFQTLLSRRRTTSVTDGWTTAWPRQKLEREIPWDACDPAAAIGRVTESLKESKSNAEIVFLTDGQRRSWAEPGLREKLAAMKNETFTLRVLDVAPPADAPFHNAGLRNLKLNRAVATAGQEFLFEGEIAGDASLQAFIDDRPVGRVPVTRQSAERGTFRFAHRFTDRAYHSVRFQLPDDDFPGDNRFEFAVRVVPPIVVWLIHADAEPDAATTWLFLRDALAPPSDPTPIFEVKAIPLSAWREITAGDAKPRVIVLHDVSKLSQAQVMQLEAFVRAGGGLFVTPGPKVDAAELNRMLAELLAGKLLEPTGDEATIEKAARLETASFAHPALRLFQQKDNAELVGAWFPRYWKLEARTAMAKLTSSDLFLVEKTLGKGRSILSAVPFDNRWRTNLTDLGDYVRLLHELLFHLAFAGGGDLNQAAGTPVYLPGGGEEARTLTIQPPSGEPIRIAVPLSQTDRAKLEQPGLYSFDLNGGKTLFVRQPDTTEWPLDLMTEEDWKGLKAALPGRILRNDEKAEMAAGTIAERPLRSWVLGLLLAFLLLETWFARRQSVG